MDQSEIEEFEKRFPDKKTALDFIDKLRSLDLSAIELNDLNEMIDDVFHIIPFGSVHIEKGTKLFRARKNDPGQIFRNISELGLNKTGNITKYGRANKLFEPVFYCGSNEHLALGEVLQNIKYSLNPRNEVGFSTLTVWETTKKLNIASIFYSEAVAKVREDIRNYKDRNRSFIREKNIINHYTLDVTDLIMEFFCDEFSKEKIVSHNDYKFSVSYANRIHDTNKFLAPKYLHERFDGLIYPSVAMKYKGDNVALFDDDLADKIKFETAFQIACVNFDFDSGNFDMYPTHKMESIDKDGNLTWVENF